jgi:hypothetical protein
MKESMDGLLRDKTQPSRIPPLADAVSEQVVALTLHWAAIRWVRPPSGPRRPWPRNEARSRLRESDAGSTRSRNRLGEAVRWAPWRICKISSEGDKAEIGHPGTLMINDLVLRHRSSSKFGYVPVALRRPVVSPAGLWAGVSSGRADDALSDSLASFYIDAGASARDASPRTSRERLERRRA